MACRRPLRVATLALALGCQGVDVESDYTLRLVPRVLGGQVPFESAPEVKLLIRHAGGRSEILYLGLAKGGRIEQPELPALRAGSLLGLLVEEPGGEPNKYNPRRLIAYGQVVLEEDLGAGEVERQLQVLIAQFGRIGDMRALNQNQAAYFPGLAMVPGGDVYLFGGARTLGVPTPGTRRILAMRDTDGGDWAFKKIPAELPADLVDLDATTVFVDGEPLVFVSGGRSDWATSGGNTTTALLFDPATETIVWGAGANQRKLPQPRSGHRSVVLSDGSVFLYGGFTGANGFDGSTWAMFDPTARAFPYSGSLDVGELGPAAASVGPAGVVACGGADLGAGPTSTHQPRADCVGVNLQGISFSVPDLPVPVGHHAMAPLPGGQILLTGGVLGPLQNNQTTAATDRAWLYDGSRWTELSPMQFPRARHALIPMPGGKVLVAGGVEEAGYIYADAEGSVLCSELYDPSTHTFAVDSGSCTHAGAAADPRWSALPGEGAFGLQGWTWGTTTAGGRSYGLAGFGPDL